MIAPSSIADSTLGNVPIANETNSLRVQARTLLHSSLLGLVAGCLLTVGVMNFTAPSTLHAVATDRQENFAIATGMVDVGIEAVYTLDFLTGELKAAVLNSHTRSFTVSYQRNIMADLGIEPGKTPKFAMVTGQTHLRTGASFKLAPTVVYVAELTSGKMGVYAFVYSQNNLSRPEMTATQEFVCLQVIPIRGSAIRD